MKRFFTTQIKDGQAVLTASERDHCVKVLRTAIGEEVEVVNGSGDLYRARLTTSDKREAVLEIIDHTHYDTSVVADVAIAIPKNPSRWEFFLEKATEIGVGNIYPLLTNRSEKHRIREERSHQIIQSAFKQALHLYKPNLHEPIKFAQLLELVDTYPQSFIAHCEKNDTPYLGSIYQSSEKSLILIGPEGDFTSEEISLALEQGVRAVSLGQSRLRVETAGIAVCNIIKCIESISS